MQIVEAMWNFKTYARFQHVRCPVLALPARSLPARSEQEASFLAFKEDGLQKIKEANPQVQVRWMEDSVHDFPLQRPALFASAVGEFVTEFGA